MTDLIFFLWHLENRGHLSKEQLEAALQEYVTACLSTCSKPYRTSDPNVRRMKTLRHALDDAGVPLEHLYRLVNRLLVEGGLH